MTVSARAGNAGTLSLRFVKALIKRGLKAGGYVAFPEASMPFGIDVTRDISRLQERQGFTPVRTIFDVGANVGQSAARFLAAFPEATIHSFEPHPQTFAKLHMAAAKEKRLFLHRLAMSNVGGSATLFTDPEHPSWNTLVLSPAKPERIAVPCSTVDDFCIERQVSFIDLLKTDTEGHDIAVLEGAARMLAGKVRFVYSEFHSLQPSNAAHATQLRDLLALMESAGFRLIATYADGVMLDDPYLITISNALFVNPATV